MTKYTFKDLARESGGLAMLAVDQREALRTMFQNISKQDHVPDEVLTNFKVTAVKMLSPYASAVLADKQFCLDEIIKTKALSSNSNLIVAVDKFIPGNGIPVDDVVIDKSIDPKYVREIGGKALKLLVLWREDEDKEERIQFVNDFCKLCDSAGLVSIIEPVVRPPRHHSEFNKDECILKAAKELGDTNADIYKIEMPLGGVGSYQKLVDATARINDFMKMPWVILSSGVAPDLFPRAVRAAMASGASGFLAGRAVWSNVVGQTDMEMMLKDLSIPRLQTLANIVDESMARR